MSDCTSVTARPAATILVLRDDPFEVLMVRRSQGGMFSSALVFPGGLVDPEDSNDAWAGLVRNGQDFGAEQRALRIAAFRETFEEAAILLADGAPNLCPPEGEKGSAQAFREMIAQTGLQLDLSCLTPFGHWVTPSAVPKRFDTHFFLAQAPAGQDAVCDGGETVALEWVAPKDALARAEAGERAILFPTRMNLRRLAASENSAAAIAAARTRAPFTVHPQVEERDGGTAVMIPAEAGYGVTEDFRPKGARG